MSNITMLNIYTQHFVRYTLIKQLINLANHVGAILCTWTYRCRSGRLLQDVEHELTNNQSLQSRYEEQLNSVLFYSYAANSL